MNDENEFLKSEEENDPAKIQKEAIELQREGVKLMREQIAKERAATARVVGDYPRPLEQKLMAFEVRKIENGWIIGVHDIQRARHGYNEKPVETYCSTAEELVKAAAAKVKAFTDGEAS